eukprot:scaffold111593_cov13-Tisochrysis_lutea.AAC.1
MISAEAYEERSVLLHLALPTTCPTSSQSGSKSNKLEAEGVARVVQALIQAGESAADIGVVTPYISQAACVRRPGVCQLSEKVAKQKGLPPGICLVGPVVSAKESPKPPLGPAGCPAITANECSMHKSS